MAWLKFLRQYWSARHRAALPVTLTRRRIFILPTKSGFVFGLFLVAMLVAAINYTNNLAFLLVFILGSVAIISAIHAYATLAGLVILNGQLGSVSCGQPATLTLVIDPQDRLRHACITQGQTSVSMPVSHGGPQQVQLTMATFRRGLLKLGPIQVQTRYPLGLFRAWAPLILPITGLVYPQSIAPRALDLAHAAGLDPTNYLHSQAWGEFSGLRAYRPEDGPTRIYWKGSARGSGLQAKEYQDHKDTQTLFLDWDQLRGQDYEQRISRMAGLVLEAEKKGLDYGLRLPGQSIAPSSGLAHVHNCLKALALMPEET